MKPLKTKILIVENESLVAMDISDCLKNSSYEVVGVASCGEDALKQVDEKRPDLILMDIMLDGEMDGIEAASVIRLRSCLPVIFLTAFTERNLIDRAKLTQPFGYLTKPFEDRELLANIEMALYRHQQERLFLKNSNWFPESLSNLNDGLILVDMYNNVVFMNTQAQDLTGWSEDAVCLPLNKAFRIYKTNDDRSSCVSEVLTDSLIIDVFSDGMTVSFEKKTCLVRKDGRKIPIDGSITPITTCEGLILGAVLVFQDITHEKSETEPPRHSHPEKLINVAADGTIDSFHRGAERVFGFEADEVVGKNIERVLPNPFQSGMTKDGSFYPIHRAIHKMRAKERSLFIGLLYNLVMQKTSGRLVFSKETDHGA